MGKKYKDKKGTKRKKFADFLRLQTRNKGISIGQKVFFIRKKHTKNHISNEIKCKIEGCYTSGTIITRYDIL